jgi:cellulose synthase/poly-beta-1,6-N-acetylglucosamine synthase-like glycosyltransferase
MNSLSVVIPAYHAENIIFNALNSLNKSTVLPINTIVVEDGVFDDLQTHLCDKSEITLITKLANAGAAAARNTGLAAIQSKFVFFLDADDYVDEELFESLAQVLDSSNADVAFGPWRFVYDNVPLSSINIPILKSNEEFIARWMHNECFPPCCVMWRTESLRRIGGWNESFRHNDDAELVIRALLDGFKVAVTNQGCGYYVQHDSPHRVSQAASAIATEAANGIFSMVVAHESASTSAVLRDALAAFAYEQARRAYRAGEPRWGAIWHGRAKARGLDGHLGTTAHKILATVLGLNLKERLAHLRDYVPAFKHRYK